MLHALHMNETTTCDTPVDELKEMNPEVVSDDDEGDQMEKDFQLDEASCFMNGHGSHRTSIYIAAKISPHFSKDFLVEDDDSTAWVEVWCYSTPCVFSSSQSASEFASASLDLNPCCGSRCIQLFHKMRRSNFLKMTKEFHHQVLRPFFYPKLQDDFILVGEMDYAWEEVGQ